MSLEPLRNLLAQLTRLDAPVGFEEPVLEFCARSFAPYCPRIECDVRGNIYAYLDSPNENAPRVMITAHADEIGFMVTSLHPDGFLRFTCLSYPTEMTLPGQRVRILTPRPIEGVIGVHSSFVLRKSVDSTALPLSYLKKRGQSAFSAQGLR